VTAVKRRIVAAVAGLAVLLPAAGSPAWADNPEDPAPDTGGYFEIAMTLLSSALEKSSGGFTPDEIATLMLETVSAVNGVKVDLLGRVNSLAVADVRAGVEYTVNNVQFVKLRSTAGGYVNTVAGHIATANTRLDVFSPGEDAALDTVGRALITEYNAFLNAEIKVGLTPSYGDYKAALNHILATTHAHCAETTLPKTDIVMYSCSFNNTTYAGYETNAGGGMYSYDSKNWMPGTIPRDKVEAYVLRGTSVDLARRALDDLNAHGQ
jgi:hypothetical protein